MTKIKFNEQGTCPFCGSNDLEYDIAQRDGYGGIYYSWACNDCGAKGEEVYNLDFVGHYNLTKNGKYYDNSNNI